MSPLPGSYVWRELRSPEVLGQLGKCPPACVGTLVVSLPGPVLEVGAILIDTEFFHLMRRGGLFQEQGQCLPGGTSLALARSLWVPTNMPGGLVEYFKS